MAGGGAVGFDHLAAGQSLDFGGQSSGAIAGVGGVCVAVAGAGGAPAVAVADAFCDLPDRRWGECTQHNAAVLDRDRAGGAVGGYVGGSVEEPGRRSMVRLMSIPECQSLRGFYRFQARGQRTQMQQQRIFSILKKENYVSVNIRYTTWTQNNTLLMHCYCKLTVLTYKRGSSKHNLKALGVAKTRAVIHPLTLATSNAVTINVFSIRFTKILLYDLSKPLRKALQQHVWSFHIIKTSECCLCNPRASPQVIRQSNCRFFSLLLKRRLQKVHENCEILKQSRQAKI